MKQLIIILLYSLLQSINANETPLFIFQTETPNHYEFAIPIDQQIEPSTLFQLRELKLLDLDLLTEDQTIDILRQLRPNGLVLPEEKTPLSSKYNFDDIPKKIEEKAFSFSTFLSSAQQFICDNALILATGTCIYTCFVWKLYQLSKVVNRTRKWVSWKDEIPLEALRDMKHQKIHTALLEAIHEEYGAQEDTLSDPILLFKKATAHDIAELERFTHFYRFLKRTWLSYLFPSYEKLYQEAQDKIDRLMFLEELFEDSLKKYAI